jgi:hypothetical protein
MDNTLKTPTTGKDFFLHLAGLVTLYTTFGSLITLVFNYINYYFPDVLTDSYYYYDPYSSGVRFSISMLLVIFPAFLGATYLINKELRATPEKQTMWVRRWSIYLTIFIASGIIIGDLVTLVNTFLNGEITARFMYKVLAMLLISAFTIAYFIEDIKGKFIASQTRARIYGVIAIVLVFGSMVAGFFIVGTPGEARLRQFDQQKINDLQSIQWTITDFYQMKEEVPKTLEELNNPISGYQVPTDRQTGMDYSYTAVNKLSYKLCANFNLDMDTRAYPASNGKDVAYSSAYDNSPAFWKYKKGETCFDRTIDPKMYPPIKNSDDQMF